MLSTEKYFESFDKAGFLKPASWTPSTGGGPYTCKVRFRAPSSVILNGSLRIVDFEIEYPASQLPGLRQGEQLTIDGVIYRVRENPEQVLDGTVCRAELARGA